MSRADALADSEVIAVRHLRTLLLDVGYPQLYQQLITMELFTADRAGALRTVGDLDEPERSLLTLLALGAPVPSGDVAGPSVGPLLDVVSSLRDVGLVIEDHDGFRTDGWVVVPALRGLLMTGTPPTYEAAEQVGASAYVGFDSLRLAAALPPTRGRRVLDLGAGCGIQGLLAAVGASEAVLTDIDVRSLRLSALNAVLNEVDHPVTLVSGDLYAPVTGEQFDLVVTLPPYVPTVPGSATSDTVAGGPDGLGMIRRVVGGAHDALSPGGELVAVCQLLCDDDGPLLTAELGSLAHGLDSRLVVTDWHPLQPYIVELATRLATHRKGGSEGDSARLISRYSDSLRSFGATGVCTAVLRLRRPVVAGGRTVTKVLGRAPAVRDSDVAVPVGTMTFDLPAGLLAASVAGVATALVDEPTAALLRVADGERNIREVATVAWGPLPDAARADLVDQAIHRLSQAQGQGLVDVRAKGDA
jgi:hypothetical protein